MADLVAGGYIPLSKSWHIRMGVLDLLGYKGVTGSQATASFLERQRGLPEDLRALLEAMDDWLNRRPVYVGESGTLYRCLRFAAWKANEARIFVKKGTLQTRKICDDPAIVHWPLEKLLTLDSGTSQWATAAVLCGAQKRMLRKHYMLNLTYEAVDQWQQRRKEGRQCDVRYDDTLLRQATAFLNCLRTDTMTFEPRQAEDYCFARAFGLMTEKQGLKRWPGLRQHESDRISEMEKVMIAAENGLAVASRDHRVIQAYTMYQLSRHRHALVDNPECVRKSWPQFWRFHKNALALARDETY
jgi:hypothetical protein